MAPPAAADEARDPETVSDYIAAARHHLVAAKFPPEDAALDAEVLARHVLGWDRVRLLADGRQRPPADFARQYRAALERRLQHEPVALITGHREFWNLDFTVTPATLVPRPETEIIVEEALRLLPADKPATVLDIGTGTGCLGVTLAYERPLTRVVATDVSFEALRVARHNARTHGVLDRMYFVRTHLADGVSVCADVIVSNPPYVSEDTATTLPPDVIRYEPVAALFAGPDGLNVIRRLLTTLPPRLAPHGRFIVEFGFGQEHSVRTIAESAGWSIDRVLPDLQGIARTMVLAVPSRR